jgi:hypothetical protein
MNCFKPDHPCYSYACPPFLRSDGSEKTTHDPPFIHPLLAAFIPFSPAINCLLLLQLVTLKKGLLPLMKGGGRRFDTIWNKGLG